MPAYAACMKKGSELYISGFYTEDIPVLREKAESLGMEYVHHREKAQLGCREIYHEISKLPK